MSMTPPVAPPLPIVLAELAAATDRLLATVDSMSADDFTAPSVLPGWSRAHVLAHLALNAKGLAGVLTTLGQEYPLPMYASGKRRDSDIDQLTAADPAHVADRLAVGASVLAQHMGAGPTPEDALELVGAAGDAAQANPYRSAEAASSFAQAVADNAEAVAAWSPAGTFERVPGGPVFAAADIPLMRWREVEIHHADLGLDYQPSQWSAAFASYLYEIGAYDREGAPLVLAATDGPSFQLGEPTDATADSAGSEPEVARVPSYVTVRGSMADLAFWLVGRGSGEGLTSDGPLPALGPWVRRA